MVVALLLIIKAMAPFALLRLGLVCLVMRARLLRLISCDELKLVPTQLHDLTKKQGY